LERGGMPRSIFCRTKNHIASNVSGNPETEVRPMAKKGMKRINPRHPKRTQMDHWQNLPTNEMQPVPEHRGKKPAPERHL
jgi:hypothetical protein